MRNNKVTRRDVLILSISFFIIVAVWIGLSVYHAIVTSTISEDLQLKITPIAENFDTSVIDKLKKREQVNPFENTNQPASASSSADEVTSNPSLPAQEETLTPEPSNTINQQTTTQNQTTTGP